MKTIASVGHTLTLNSYPPLQSTFHIAGRVPRSKHRVDITYLLENLQSLPITFRIQAKLFSSVVGAESYGQWSETSMGLNLTSVL